MWPSVRFIDSQLQRETVSVLLCQTTENRQPECTRGNFYEKIRRETVQRFVIPDQYKQSATFVAVLWKQTCTEYNICDTLALIQAVTLKSRFSFALLHLSVFSLSQVLL